MVSSHPFAMRDTVEIPRITTKPLVQKYATKGVPRGVDWDQNLKTTPTRFASAPKPAAKPA